MIARFALLALLFTLGPATASAVASDFVIESRVFLADGDQPHSHNITIFSKGIAYDYSAFLGEISILDPGGQRFILLNPSRQIKTYVPLGVVEDFTRGVQPAAAQSPKPFVKFLANPQFEEDYIASIGKMTFQSQFLTYELTTIPAANDEVSAQYQRFSDWYAKLNTMTNPAGLPPFARLRVNQVLHERKRLPGEVRLTLRAGDGQQELKLRSEHKIRWQLEQIDTERVRETDMFFQTFATVRPEEYFQSPEEPAATPPANPAPTPPAAQRPTTTPRR